MRLSQGVRDHSHVLHIDVQISFQMAMVIRFPLEEVIRNSRREANVGATPTIANNLKYRSEVRLPEPLRNAHIPAARFL